ncbi:hypothetical protein LPU83_pLPU83c_0633 (plasmid) [Rhizobium favelukesii]|uniref:Uncharacterized protein n=1 Tax=Rhizobium favelukesii TaxID=348824 RepID=W6RLT1_9HYPH|nr:hypothetical protein LPU83_pLPU83c_0633 [Rhizobium favelukesii]
MKAGVTIAVRALVAPDGKTTADPCHDYLRQRPVARGLNTME